MLGASVALHFRDPHQSGSWGFCPWLLLTGTYCPGCGGLRAVNDLTRGDLGAAASSNLLFVSSIPIVAWLWVRSVSQRWRGVRESAAPDAGGGRRDASACCWWSCSGWSATSPFGAWLAP